MDSEMANNSFLLIESLQQPLCNPSDLPAIDCSCCQNVPNFVQTMIIETENEPDKSDFDRKSEISEYVPISLDSKPFLFMNGTYTQYVSVP